VRISVEAPREYDNYLYVVDREVYKDNNNKGERLGEPSLIFPARSTPPGGNVISAGKSVYVHAQGDPIPYFTLQRSGGNHIGEMLFILISLKPLPAPVGRTALDMATVAQWERQCGGQIARRRGQTVDERGAGGRRGHAQARAERPAAADNLPSAGEAGRMRASTHLVTDLAVNEYRCLFLLRAGARRPLRTCSQPAVHAFENRYIPVFMRMKTVSHREHRGSSILL
jgi:hypothetical protein